MLSTFTVTNSNDSGAGSLRQAILDANGNGGADTIEFNIPATEPGFVDVDSALIGGDAAADAFVIQPLSGLPALTDDETTIDGRTQTAFTGDTNPFGPEVVLDGSLQASGVGVAIFSNANQVHGLNIQRFTGSGIRIEGASNNWFRPGSACRTWHRMYSAAWCDGSPRTGKARITIRCTLSRRS